MRKTLNAFFSNSTFQILGNSKKRFLHLYWLKLGSVFVHTEALPPYQGNTIFLYQNRTMQIRSLSETPNFVRKAITLQQIDIFGNF